MAVGHLPPGWEGVHTTTLLGVDVGRHGRGPLVEQVDVVEDHVGLADLVEVDEATHANPREEALLTVELCHTLQQWRLFKVKSIYMYAWA